MRMFKFLIMFAGFLSSSYAQSLNISEAEVIETQQKWGAGIVKIGEVYLNNQSGGNAYEAAKEAATQHINDLYDYQSGTVLFKPTLVSETSFRPTFEGALSYFVGGNDNFPEDQGFAIKPWTNVRFETHDIIITGIQAIAMGHYYFTDLNGSETRVEFTLGFIKRHNDIKINVQKSTLPYSPAK